MWKFYLKSDVFKNSPKVTIRLGYFCNIYFDPELSKIAQSGRTGNRYHIPCPPTEQSLKLFLKAKQGHRGRR